MTFTASDSWWCIRPTSRPSATVLASGPTSSAGSPRPGRRVSRPMRPVTRCFRYRSATTRGSFPGLRLNSSTADLKTASPSINRSCTAAAPHPEGWGAFSIPHRRFRPCHYVSKVPTCAPCSPRPRRTNAASSSVKDHGVYFLAERGERTPEGRQKLLAYAIGCNPDIDPFDDWWERARAELGGDDFAEVRPEVA